MLLPAVLTVLLILVSGEGGGATEVRPICVTGLDPAHLQLLKDALGWMSFRKDGRLMEDSELESLFLEPLIRKYNSSMFYRTFVVAFQHGVLPKLTLNENDACDPAYTLEYKDPMNGSVTWHYQKKFTFKSFERRDSEEVQFCDYRQGLKCHPIQKICLCPEGSSMEPIKPNSEKKRCLLQENQVCALIDMDHSTDPKHSALASNLHHLIFNLEKPVSCAEGTQCRFKDYDRNYPLCYSKGPWDRDTERILDFGEECALGLYASSGTCAAPENSLKIGTRPGYTCFNFGPPRSSPLGTENRIGFCSFEEGSYGLVTLQLSVTISHRETGQHLNITHIFRPLFIAFVHPRTVHLRGEELRQFYSKYLDFIGSIPQFDDVLEENAGGRCSVKKTEVMEGIWKYFASLEDTPPPGQDYVPGATKAELDANLEAAVNLTVDWKKKVCRVYQERRGSFRESLRCVPDGTTDADGNDGTCQQPGNLNTTQFSEKVKDLLERINTAYTEQNFEEFTYNGHLPAFQTFGSIPPKNVSLKYPLPLFGGWCRQSGTFCYNDDVTPTWRVVTIPVINSFGLSVDTRNPDSKDIVSHERINRAFERLQNLSSSGKGDQCNFVMEYLYRLSDESSLSVLIDTVLHASNGKGGKSKHICGPGLKCSPDDKCEWIDPVYSFLGFQFSRKSFLKLLFNFILNFI